jgi:hypothetical protein
MEPLLYNTNRSARTAQLRPRGNNLRLPRVHRASQSQVIARRIAEGPCIVWIILVLIVVVDFLWTYPWDRHPALLTATSDDAVLFLAVADLAVIRYQ